MFDNENEILKLVRVAEMYYQEEMTQAEIAKILKVSRPSVSNMLQKARELGIVNIEIKSPIASNNLLLGQLKSIFNIQGGIIVPQASNDYLTEQLILGQSCNFLLERLSEVRNIGLGWGYAIGEFIEKFEGDFSTGKFSGNVSPLIGTANIPSKGYHPNELVRVFAEKTGFDPHYMFAPAFPATEQEQKLFKNTDNYREVYEQWEKIDTVILSVGSYPSVPDQATAVRFGDRLQEEGAVGMILSYYFNRNGEIIEGDNDHAIHVPLEVLKNAKRIIAIFPSKGNINAIVGALRTGIITHLITDDKTAADIIKLKN